MSRPSKTRSLKAVPKATEAKVRRILTSEEIKIRAYEIYLARGAGQGADLDDWLQAERELKSKD
jgi:hypothetical protein